MSNLIEHATLRLAADVRAIKHTLLVIVLALLWSECHPAYAQQGWPCSSDAQCLPEEWCVVQSVLSYCEPRPTPIPAGQTPTPSHTPTPTASGPTPIWERRDGRQCAGGVCGDAAVETAPGGGLCVRAAKFARLADRWPECGTDAYGTPTPPPAPTQTVGWELQWPPRRFPPPVGKLFF